MESCRGRREILEIMLNSMISFCFGLQGEPGPAGPKGESGNKGEPVSMVTCEGFFSMKKPDNIRNKSYLISSFSLCLK